MKYFINRTSVLPLLLALIFLSACNSHHAERLQTSGVNSTFNFDTSKSFEEYVDHSRRLIESGRVDINQTNKDKLVSWNAPFILYPNSKDCATSARGILLVHGLSDSPYTTRALAHYFNQHCFTVYSVLLTGHGTRPGDLLEVSYKDWVKQVEYGVQTLSEKVDDIYIGGFSTGAALAAHYTLSNPSQKVEAIVALAPALNLDTIASLTPIIKYFKPYIDVYLDEDLVKYESFTTNAAAQIYLLTQDIDKKLKQDNTPLMTTKLFAALAYEDQTINPTKTLTTLIENTDPDRRHITLYHQYDLPKEVMEHKNLYSVNSAIEGDNILGLSHTSLPNSPEDSWYGKEGEYRNCLHYFGERDKNQNYTTCKSSSDIFFGETTADNLNKGVMVRLSYNPFIEQLFLDISRFIESH